MRTGGEKWSRREVLQKWIKAGEGEDTPAGEGGGLWVDN